jgi:hypothetical protein
LVVSLTIYKKEPPIIAIIRAKIPSIRRIPRFSNKINKNTSLAVIKIASHKGMLNENKKK